MSFCITICKDFQDNTFDYNYIEEILEDFYPDKHQNGKEYIYKEVFNLISQKFSLNLTHPFKCINWQDNEFDAYRDAQRFNNGTELIKIPLARKNENSITEYFIIGIVATKDPRRKNQILYKHIGYKQINFKDLNCLLKKYY